MVKNCSIKNLSRVIFSFAACLIVFLFAFGTKSVFAQTYQAPTPAPTQAPPKIGAIKTTTDPITINTPVSAGAAFTDLDTTDTHTAVWDWGDGSTSVGTIIESNGSGTVANSHTYVSPGIYEINLTVKDSQGGVSKADPFDYVIVYDPTAGWLAGGKTFSTGYGPADFGFQAKYSNNNIAPSGKNATLSLPGLNIDFVSTQYQWLVINGNKATFKGTGTFNGTPGYGVLISAIDGGLKGPDYIRYKITNPTGGVIFDTQPGSADTADPTTLIDTTKGGKITIH